MNKKWTISIMALAALFVLIVAYTVDNQDICGEKKSFNVSSGSSKLSDVIDAIKTMPHYEGYDAKTVKWMESLGNKRVFFGNDSIIIMNSIDAGKIPKTPDMTDVYVYDHFTAEVIENHSLCNRYPTAYYVHNVNYTDREVIDTGLA